MIIAYKIEPDTKSYSKSIIAISIALLLIWTFTKFMLEGDIVQRLFNYSLSHPLMASILSTVIHDGFAHVLGNSYAFLIVGTYVVNSHGHKKLASLIFPFVFFNALIELSSGIFSVGFSGCLMVLIGYVMAVNPDAQIRLKYFFIFRNGDGSLGLFWVAIFGFTEDIVGLLNNIHTNGDGVSHIGHLIGFTYGVLFALHIDAKNTKLSFENFKKTVFDKFDEFVHITQHGNVTPFQIIVSGIVFLISCLTCISVYLNMTQFSPDQELNKIFAIKLITSQVVIMLACFIVITKIRSKGYLLLALLTITILLNMAFQLPIIGVFSMGMYVFISMFVRDSNNEQRQVNQAIIGTINEASHGDSLRS